jgi:Flp pilus assembly protein TadG
MKTLRGILSRLRTRRSGQALVEFALISPILLLLIVALLDFSRAWAAHHAVADATREAARMLVVDDTVTQADATARVNERLATAGMDPSLATITYVEGAARGEPTTVTIDYPFDLWILGRLVNFASGEFNTGNPPGTLNLHGDVTMRTE